MPAYTPAPDVLAGRIILVTGAGEGIGRATALAFAAHGAHVILLDRRLQAIESVYDEIERRGGLTPALLPFDLEANDLNLYESTAQTVEREFGRLDGLLHNAAELGGLTPIELYNPEIWQRVLQINLTAPFLLTRACLPLLKQSQDASVVFTSADVGRKGRAYWGAYSVAAFGTEGLMQILADEVATNTPIRVNSIDPGAVRTRLRTLAYPAEPPDAVPPPESITTTYVYLMSADSRGVTGRAFEAERSASADVQRKQPD